MTEWIVQPVLAGLSTGLFCCVYCLPFLAPVFAAEERSGRETAGLLVRFLAGRFAGYIAFGALFGYLGAALAGPVARILSSVCLVLLSVVLIAYAVGVMRPGSWCLGGRRVRARTPFVMGLLMGVNVCPPFLMSLAYVVTLHSALKGVLYFVLFFAATSLYFVPFLLFGMLGRMREFQAVARVSAVLVGLIFSAYGLYTITKGASLLHTL